MNKNKKLKRQSALLVKHHQQKSSTASLFSSLSLNLQEYFCIFGICDNVQQVLGEDVEGVLKIWLNLFWWRQKLWLMLFHWITLHLIDSTYFEIKLSSMLSHWIIKGEDKDGCFREFVVAGGDMLCMIYNLCIVIYRMVCSKIYLVKRRSKDT